jgi:hypothetical protein
MAKERIIAEIEIWDETDVTFFKDLFSKNKLILEQKEHGDFYIKKKIN